MDRFEGRCWLDWWANPSTLTPTDDRRFTLTEYTGSAKRQVDYHIDLLSQSRFRRLAAPNGSAQAWSSPWPRVP